MLLISDPSSRSHMPARRTLRMTADTSPCIDDTNRILQLPHGCRLTLCQQLSSTYRTRTFCHSLPVSGARTYSVISLWSDDPTAKSPLRFWESVISNRRYLHFQQASSHQCFNNVRYIAVSNFGHALGVHFESPKGPTRSRYMAMCSEDITLGFQTPLF
jgi:hypothetical protein